MMIQGLTKNENFAIMYSSLMVMESQVHLQTPQNIFWALLQKEALSLITEIDVPNIKKTSEKGLIQLM